MSKILRKKTRQVSAATLIASAVILLMFVFVDRSRSANPANGTIGPAGPNVSWEGDAAGGTSQLSEESCVEGVSCDTFVLTVSGTPANWAGKKVRLDFSWIDVANDYDVYVHKGADPDAGPVVGSSTGTHLSTNTERVELDPNQTGVGTGVFSVRVVYFIVAPQTGVGPAPGNDQYKAVASAVAGALPSPSPTPGGSPTPTATPVVGIPRMHNHYAPTGVADDAGEPTIGSNWQSERTFTNNNIVTGAANPPIPNGGTTNYFGGFLSYMLRVRFNDCSSPAIAPFEQKPLLLAATPRVFGDPILFTDHLTGRTFVAQLEGLTPIGSTIDITDDDGDTFMPSQGAGPSCIDHQTIGGGPFRDPIPGGVTDYPHAVYYASQCVSNATSELSLDGGITFPIQGNMFTASDCAGLHGHIKIAPDGTAYVPDKACSAAGVPFVFGGEASVAVSENNGLTWAVRQIPGATSDAGVDDPSVGVSWCPPAPLACNKAQRSSTIYLGFMFDDGRAGIAKSTDKGVTWSPPVDVGAQVGVKHIAFPAVAVGDPDRAAYAFFGTTTAGNYSAPEFPGVWYLYLSTTFDGGKTWTTQNLTPNDPIQRGGICGDGTCRNLLDFFDMTIDKQGRLLIAGEDGCIGSCVNGGPNSFTAKAFISRQAGGKRMFAAFDPVEPGRPGAPLVDGSIDSPPTEVNLSWPEPDHGGSPITAYKIYRAPAANGPFTLRATVQVNNFTDTGLLADNYYRVTAVNAVGESPFCRTFHAVTVTLPDPCKLPGVKVTEDLNPDGSDKDSGQNTPLDPRVNAKQLFVAEPFVSAGVNKLFFTLQVEPSPGSTSAPPNSQWFIIWNRISGPAADGSDRIYVAMRSDAAGDVSFEYGNFGPPLDPLNPVPNANTPTKLGDADKGTYNPETGVIRIEISNSKLENIKAGNDLAGLNVRTYFNRPDPGQRSQNNASDITDDTTYALRGNASCGVAEIGKLLNISTRELVGTGDNVLIGGFIVKGPGNKKVIMRGIGPSLKKGNSPFPGRMNNPTLELHDATKVIATNDDWDDSQKNEIQAEGFAPGDPKESALIRTLAPGQYTVILRDKDNQSGIGVVEAYDLNSTAPSELANISSRGNIGTGDNILIGGFVAGPKTAARTKVVARAIGPSIKNQVPNTVDDPTLEIRNSFGTVIAENDNWQQSANKAEIQASGLAPKNNAESAILKVLTPGQYTALVRGKNNTTGVGVVEIYHIP